MRFCILLLFYMLAYFCDLGDFICFEGEREEKCLEERLLPNACELTAISYKVYGRTTPNHYLCNSCSPGRKQMKFMPLWGPVQIFVGLLVPSHNLKKSLKPLQHNEHQKNLKF